MGELRDSLHFWGSREIQSGDSFLVADKMNGIAKNPQSMRMGVGGWEELNARSKLQVILRVDLKCKMQIQMQTQI